MNPWNQNSTSWNAIQNTMNYTNNTGRMEEISDFVKSWPKEDNSTLTTLNKNTNNGALNFQGHQNMGELNFSTNFNEGVAQNPFLTTPTLIPSIINLQGHQDMRQLDFTTNFNEGVHQNPIFTTHTPTTFINNNNNGDMNIQGHQDMRQLSFTTNFDEGVHQNPIFTTHTPTTFINNNNNGAMNIQGHQDMRQLSFTTNFDEGVHQNPIFTTHTPTAFINNNGTNTINNNNIGVLNTQSHEDMRQLSFTTNFNEGVHQNPIFTTHTPTTFINNNDAMNIQGHQEMGCTNFNNSVDQNLFLQSMGSSSAVYDTLCQVQNNYFLPPTPPNTDIIPNFNHMSSSFGTSGFEELNYQTQMGNGIPNLYEKAETARNSLIQNNMFKSSQPINNNVDPIGPHELTLSQKMAAQRMLLASNGINVGGLDAQSEENLNKEVVPDEIIEDDDMISGEEEEEEEEIKKYKTPAKNVLSERRRRGRLDESLRKLRSVVPKITKLNKKSILVDAIDHIKELNQKIDNLKNELESTTPPPSSSVIISTPTSNEELYPIPKTGLLRSTLTALDSLGLDIQQAVISCFDDFVFNIFKAKQCKEGQEFPTEYIKAVILKSADEKDRSS